MKRTYLIAWTCSIIAGVASSFFLFATVVNWGTHRSSAEHWDSLLSMIVGYVFKPRLWRDAFRGGKGGPLRLLGAAAHARFGRADWGSASLQVSKL